MKRIRLTTALLIALAMVMPIAARQQAAQPDSGLLTLDTMSTYAPQFPGELQWQADGSGHFMLGPSAVKRHRSAWSAHAARGARTLFTFPGQNRSQGPPFPTYPSHDRIRSAVARV